LGGYLERYFKNGLLYKRWGDLFAKRPSTGRNEGGIKKCNFRMVEPRLLNGVKIDILYKLRILETARIPE